MRRIFLMFLTALVAVSDVRHVSAFTLIGPLAPWQTTTIGYATPADIGGPMNISEAYRWSVPRIYYAFDESFLNYFGQQAVVEVEKAIAMMNALPPMSQIDINKYPRYSQRVNFQAQALGLFDVRSVTLSRLLEMIGLTDPTRYVFTLRLRDTTIPMTTNYLTIMRNFDPDTWRPSPYINGQLWTWTTIFDNQNGVPGSFPVTQPVDPLLFAEPVATFAGGGVTTLPHFETGSYYTGLTRDDVGGLYYIYQPLNRVTESAPTNSFRSSGFFFSSGGGGAGSPFGAPGGQTGTGSPFGPSQFALTNVVNTNGVSTTNIITVAVNTNIIDQAVRGGIDKITFVRANYDSLVGALPNPIIDVFTDTVVTNGVRVQQQLTRVLTQPDIVFVAQDLAAPAFSDSLYARNNSWVNNSAINGAGIAGDGPGQMIAPSFMRYNKVGPAFINTFPGGDLSQAGASPVAWWGSFDGSTNAPVLYPTKFSIQQLERLVLGGQ